MFDRPFAYIVMHVDWDQHTGTSTQLQTAQTLSNYEFAQLKVAPTQGALSNMRKSSIMHGIFITTLIALFV